MGKVMVFGSCAVDLAVRSSRLPVPGETIRGSSFQMGPGGKGLNQGVAAHKAGADVTLVTKLGKDGFGQMLTRFLEEQGMETGGLIRSGEVSTGAAMILVDEGSGQNEIIIVPDACDRILPEETAELEELVSACEYGLLQLEVNQDANERVVKLAEKYGCRMILNPAPAPPEQLCDAFYSGVYMVTPNEVEAEEITGVQVRDLRSAQRAAAYFHEKGVQAVVITLGRRGAFVSAEGKAEIIPAFSVEAADTTGAGDAFNGGLLAALSEGKSIWEAARFASALAALSVQKQGAAASMPRREEIEEFLNTHNPM